MYLNIENIVSQMLADMSAAFPNASLVEVQKVYSLIFLVEMITNFGVAWLVSKLSKRKIIILFQAGTVIGGLIGYFWGTKLATLYLSSIIIGISAAIIGTMSKAVVPENFTTQEAPRVIAISQIATSLGSVMLYTGSGYLMVRTWRNGYLAFLFGLVSLFAALFLLPEGPVEIRVKDENGKKPKIWTKDLVHDVVITAVFFIIFITYSSNLSYLVAEKGFGNSVMVGYLSSVLTAFTFVAAVIFTKSLKLTKKYILVISCHFVLLGFGLITISRNIWWVVIGTAFVGLGQGTFTPAVFTHVSRYVKQNTNSVSYAMINAAGSCGYYLAPYIITIPSALFGAMAVNRFEWAIVLMALMILGEFIFQKKQQESVY